MIVVVVVVVVVVVAMMMMRRRRRRKGRKRIMLLVLLIMKSWNDRWFVQERILAGRQYSFFLQSYREVEVLDVFVQLQQREYRATAGTCAPAGSTTPLLRCPDSWATFSQFPRISHPPRCVFL